MKFLVTGSSTFTLRCTSILFERAEVVGFLALPTDQRPINSASTQEYTDQHGVPYAEFSDIESAEAIAWQKSKKPDYILSGWPFLVGKKILMCPVVI